MGKLCDGPAPVKDVEVSMAQRIEDPARQEGEFS